MRRILGCVTALVLVVGVGLTGCVDQQMPLEPDTLPQDFRPFFSYQPAPGFDVLRRTSPLDESVSATRALGTKGGRIRLNEAGIVLDIPRGALEDKTEITVTALAGDAVAFTFSPHGIQFLKPATVRVDVAGTTAEQALAGAQTSKKSKKSGKSGEALRLDAFLGVYFEGDPSMSVRPLEILETFLDRGQIGFRIGHFSGYALVGG